MQEDIVVRDLVKCYGSNPVLNAFSYTFPRREITCIMGKSGCGKTTLLSILMGLVKADSGIITGLSGKRLSAVFQEDRLIEPLTVYKNLRLVCGKQVTDEQIFELLERLDLHGCGKQRISELSGGMKRRVSIARGILVPFDVLFLDEAFKGLDRVTREKVIEEVRRRAKGQTVICATHEWEETEMLGGTVLTMK